MQTRTESALVVRCYRGSVRENASSSDGTTAVSCASLSLSLLVFLACLLAWVSDGRVRAGGPSPNSNTALAQLLTAAKQSGVPKDVIDRNVKKASEKGQADYTEIVYEVRGGLMRHVCTCCSVSTVY